MNVSAVSTAAAANSPEALETERTVLTLKKQQDATDAQAQALLELVKRSGDIGRNIDVYA